MIKSVVIYSSVKINMSRPPVVDWKAAQSLIEAHDERTFPPLLNYTSANEIAKRLTAVAQLTQKSAPESVLGRRYKNEKVMLEAKQKLMAWYASWAEQPPRKILQPFNEQDRVAHQAWVLHSLWADIDQAIEPRCARQIATLLVAYARYLDPTAFDHVQK
jgi:hypothetical protein